MHDRIASLARRIAILGALSLWACGQAMAAKDPYVFEYHGWHVDASRDSSEPADAVVAAIKRQLDIVESRAIAQDILTFMRSVPIWTDPSRADGSAAHYDRAKGVDLRLRELDPKKPIVLHELLRAFHEQRLGLNDKNILKGYERARASGAWPADSAMLKDAREFVAATSTVYLFGTIDTPPFTQGQVQQALPEYWTWLGGVFDGFRGCE